MPTLAVLVGSRPLRRGDVSDAVKLAQQDLRLAGAELQDDGKFGPITEAAVRRYQAAHGIMPNGLIDGPTAKSLDHQALADRPDASAPALPSALAAAPWLSTMRAITGHKEIPGEADDPFVLGMAVTIGQKFPDLYAYSREYTHDSIPWCGLTIAYVMAMNGIRPVTKGDGRVGGDTGAEFGFLWADDWKYFGDHVAPRVGAIGVFTRNGGGHVSIIEGITPDSYIIRGGNQSDAINVTSFPKNKLTDTRWPSGFPVVDVVGITTNTAPAGSVT